MSLALSIGQLLKVQPHAVPQKRGRKDVQLCPRCKVREKVISATGIKQPYCAECFRQHTRDWRKKNAERLQNRG